MDVFGLGDMLQLVKREDGRQPPLDARRNAFVKDIQAYQAQQNGQPPPASSVGAGVATGGPLMKMPVNPAAMPQDVGSGMGAVAQALAYRANGPQTPDQAMAASDPWSGMRKQPMGLGRLFSR